MQKTERLWNLRWEWRQLQLLEQKWDKECAAAKTALQSAAETSKETNVEKNSEFFETVNKCYNRDHSKRDKLKNLLENVNYDQLASLKEVDDVRKMQKEFMHSEEIRFKKEIQQLQTSCGFTLLGQDRAFRKYWLVASVPAVFIEQDCWQDSFECNDQPTPVDKLLEELEGETDLTLLRQNLKVCTGVKETCPVHVSLEKNKTRWFFLKNETVLENLIGSLNRRGFREMELFDQLNFYKEFIVGEIFPRCNDDFEVLINSSKKLTTLLKNDFQVDEALEAAFRDSLLEIEEKIHAGGLGTLKVDDFI